jgi:hypothetical protein
MGEHIPCATGVLHRSEGGVRQLHVTASYVDYARELARYISCPSTVRVRTLEQFGQAPSLERIRVMRDNHSAVRAAFRREAETIAPDERDHEDFRVASFVPRPMKRVEPGRELFIAPDPVEPGTVPSSGPEIIAAIARAMSFTVAEILGPRRARPVMRARATCSYVLRERGNSYTVIGRWMNRDHSTIINACRQFEALATPAMRDLAAQFIGSRAV